MAALQRTVLTAVIFAVAGIGLSAERAARPALAADAPATVSKGATVSKPANQAGIDRTTLTYDGKPFEHWHKQLLTELKPQLRLKSLQAVISFGPNGYADEVTTDLLHILNSYTRTDMEAAASNEPDAGDEGAALLQVTYMAALAKAANGEAPSLLAPALLPEHVVVTQILTTAAQGLANAGARSIPILLRAVEDNSNPGMGRSVALSALESAGSASKPETVATLLRIIENPSTDSEVRDTATKILVDLDPAGDQILPVLTQAAKTNDPNRRAWAVTSIGRLGSAARSAVPMLKEMLADSSTPLVLAAATSLRQIDAPAKYVAVPLLKALPRIDTNTLASATRQLDELGFFVGVLAGDFSGFDGIAESESHEIAQVAPYMAVLQTFISNKTAYSPTVVSAVIQLLGSMGPKSRAAVEPLRKIAADHSSANTHADEAAQSVAKIMAFFEKH